MSYLSTIYLFKGVFGRMDFREDKKIKNKKMRRENFLESVWWGEGERKMMMGSMYFLFGSIKKISLQNGEKTEWGVVW